MIHSVPGYEPPVEALFGLASTPFKPTPFRAACERFARFDPTSSHADLWYFFVGRPAMIVSLDERAIRFAVLSICWWETYFPHQHPDLASYEAERAEFDSIFARTLEATVAALGPPRLSGQDADEHAYRWALWQGSTGLLVLQQSAYDPQFGHDVNFWICPSGGDGPRPFSPFIDWLVNCTGLDKEGG